MLILLSPAKTLDFDSPSITDLVSEPEFTAESEKLIKKLSTMSAGAISELMRISPTLAELSFNRYQALYRHPADVLSKQAITVFIGEVFRALEASNMNDADFEFAQKHLRILSGLYGVLKPLDLIQPHRLEMGTKLQIEKNKNLYEFWGDKITEKLNEVISKDDIIINLASDEYFKSINPKLLKGKVIAPVFKDMHKGNYKVIVMYAKNARGSMSNYIIKNRITNPEDLKSFDSNGYKYKSELSNEENWVFVRG